MTAEKAIALVLRGLETIQNPYAVLFKSLVHTGCVIQLASGSGKGQNPEQPLYISERPGVLIKREWRRAIAFHDAHGTVQP
jgi:hypothetical protein